jgi:hypothetical protein
MIFVSFISVSILYSCSNKTYESINVSDIMEPCDCVNAFEVITTKLVDILSDVNNVKELDKDSSLLEEYEKVNDKFDEVDERCHKLHIRKKDFKECGNIKIVMDNLDVINGKTKF